jgi:hypothetical protein
MITSAFALTINPGTYTQDQINHLDIASLNLDCSHYTTKFNPMGFFHFGVSCNRIKPTSTASYNTYEVTPYKFGVIINYKTYLDCRSLGFSKPECADYIKELVRDDVRQKSNFFKAEYADYQMKEYNLDITAIDLIIGRI